MADIDRIQGSPAPAAGRFAHPLILGRLLTRSGDHAWDLAFPLALLTRYPGTLFPMAVYYLLTRLAVVVSMPAVGARLDRADRRAAVQVGILLQTTGVIAAVLLLGGPAAPLVSDRWILPLMVAAGVLAAIGATMMTVAIRGDWVPVLFAGEALTKVNSSMSQVDLAAEIGAPVGAGMLCGAGAAAGHPYLGFQIVAFLNILSFAMEYAYLAYAYGADERLRSRPASHIFVTARAPVPLGGGARKFFRQSATPVMLAYSLLWFTVLTPHGALLTSFLKSQWHIGDTWLGVLRSAGAVMGLLATGIFGRVVRIFGLARATSVAIFLQAVSLLLACSSFSLGPRGFWLFLGGLLLSRIGLYGFMLGEVQIFQETVDPTVRGQIGGFAAAFNNFLGLAVYLVAMALPRPEQFPIIAWASALAISLGAMLTGSWYLRIGHRHRSTPDAP